MTLEDLGYNESLCAFRKEQQLESLGVGRITSEHKDRFTVLNDTGEYDAELLGSLRFAANDHNDLPAVGDWVAISEYDENKALIHAIYPRKSIVKRKAVGKVGHTQIIATNIDVGIIVQAVNRDFNINRLERYLTICNASHINAVIVLSKVDLIDAHQLEKISQQIKTRITDVPLFAISNQSHKGIGAFKAVLQKGKTYCLLGSSGVGKSTLINTISGAPLMATGEINQNIDRGKHVTTHRELIVLDNCILIDNPGMREVGITNIDDGLEVTFDQITVLSQQCKFNDCSHVNEKGCAIIAALESGELNADVYSNFTKMEKEKNHFESDALERRRKDKNFGKMIKNIQKQRRIDKY